MTPIILNSECEHHKGQGIILTGDRERCYGCYCERFDYCPLCGKSWDDPTECKRGEEIDPKEIL